MVLQKFCAGNLFLFFILRRNSFLVSSLLHRLALTRGKIPDRETVYRLLY
ncbi:hypothetical protein NRI_0647 [Neorickettsia risticii str. Illinois]|uniref:Uncharacterized protein n=1 Tax=Neorickettsia risticii (strain Illinois) TaxID=434131 RepID=C6V5F6_NEORI|nr:hypothetical protein NRI_0647 [Neorickettsia risticii str. Illinois]